MGYLPIEDHGIVGDLHTAALIGTDGTVDWLCLPAFDSPSIFASILDDEKGGHFKLQPERYDRSQQLYLPDTNVLLTRFLSPEGVAEILDFMPVDKDGHARHRLVRNVRAIRGRVTLNVECRPAFDYARAGHSVALRGAGAVLLGPLVRGIVGIHLRVLAALDLGLHLRGPLARGGPPLGASPQAHGLRPDGRFGRGADDGTA